MEQEIHMKKLTIEEGESRKNGNANKNFAV